MRNTFPQMTGLDWAALHLQREIDAISRQLFNARELAASHGSSADNTAIQKTFIDQISGLRIAQGIVQSQRNIEIQDQSELE